MVYSIVHCSVLFLHNNMLKITIARKKILQKAEQEPRSIACNILIHPEPDIMRIQPITCTQMMVEISSHCLFFLWILEESRRKENVIFPYSTDNLSTPLYRCSSLPKEAVVLNPTYMVRYSAHEFCLKRTVL
jgi:hypothetical protein